MPMFARKRWRLTIRPILMKNRLMNTSWKGWMYPSVWWEYSVFEMRSPARNAPSSGPIPIRLVANVVPMQMNSVRSIKRSLFFVRAESLRARGMNHFAPT